MVKSVIKIRNIKPKIPQEKLEGHFGRYDVQAKVKVEHEKKGCYTATIEFENSFIAHKAKQHLLRKYSKSFLSYNQK